MYSVHPRHLSGLLMTSLLSKTDRFIYTSTCISTQYTCIKIEYIYCTGISLSDIHIWLIKDLHSVGMRPRGCTVVLRCVQMWRYPAKYTLTVVCTDFVWVLNCTEALLLWPHILQHWLAITEGYLRFCCCLKSIQIKK